MAELELRRRVAEALGWTDLRVEDGELWGRYSCMSAIISECESDIAAAWQLIEGMAKSDPLEVNVTWDGESWMCNVDVSGSAWVYGKDPTAPAAICKAWLAYMEQSDE